MTVVHSPACDLVQYAITKKRLLAGLGSADANQMQFFIAEEGITAAAYIVLRVVAERRPSIRGWLPPGFVPPQITVVSARPSLTVMRVRRLGTTPVQPPLSREDVLYWRSDVF